MTPIAAYYIFTAAEHARAAAAAHGIDPYRPRPSLLDRVRALAATLRSRPSVARAA